MRSGAAVIVDFLQQPADHVGRDRIGRIREQRDRWPAAESGLTERRAQPARDHDTRPGTSPLRTSRSAPARSSVGAGRLFTRRRSGLASRSPSAAPRRPGG